MTRWALLLRAVNLGPRNKLAMADLRAVLTDLGHGEVRTYLNTGNATFTSDTSDRARLASDVEAALKERLALEVRATLRTPEELEEALAGSPEEIAKASYVLIAFLFDRPTAAACTQAAAWDVSPDRVVVADGVAYLGYVEGVHRSKLQTGLLEKKLGVAATARTPATVRKMLG